MDSLSQNDIDTTFRNLMNSQMTQNQEDGWRYIATPTTINNSYPYFAPVQYSQSVVLHTDRLEAESKQETKPKQNIKIGDTIEVTIPHKGFEAGSKWFVKEVYDKDNFVVCKTYGGHLFYMKRNCVKLYQSNEQTINEINNSTIIIMHPKQKPFFKLPRYHNIPTQTDKIHWSILVEECEVPINYSAGKCTKIYLPQFILLKDYYLRMFFLRRPTPLSEILEAEICCTALPNVGRDGKVCLGGLSDKNPDVALENLINSEWRHGEMPFQYPTDWPYMRNTQDIIDKWKTIKNPWQELWAKHRLFLTYKGYLKTLEEHYGQF